MNLFCSSYTSLCACAISAWKCAHLCDMSTETTTSLPIISGSVHVVFDTPSSAPEIEYLYWSKSYCSPQGLEQAPEFIFAVHGDPYEGKKHGAIALFL